MTIRTCRGCGQSNRVPLDKLADTGRCGACKADLAPLDEPLDVDPDAFRQIVTSAKVPVLVDFWAAWCAPCRMATPHVKRVARELAGRAIVVKVDTQQHADLASVFHVRAIPAFAVLVNGDVVLQQSGLVDHQQLRRWVEDAAAQASAGRQKGA